MRYNIAVSGAAVTKSCCDNIILVSKEVGKEIARAGCILVSGATTGVPYYSAIGCKEAGGFNIGFSPAESEIEHIKRYRLPLDAFDVMVYTGSDYTGRDIIMTKSADAVVIVCGRMGTLHEFTTAIEIRKPIGVLLGSGGIADKIQQLTKGTYKGARKIIYEKDPGVLVQRLIVEVEKAKQKNGKLLD
jgi:hypothetical protein